MIDNVVCTGRGVMVYS